MIYYKKIKDSLFINVKFRVSESLRVWKFSLVFKGALVKIHHSEAFGFTSYKLNQEVNQNAIPDKDGWLTIKTGPLAT